jgi:hypothetical protein
MSEPNKNKKVIGTFAAKATAIEWGESEKGEPQVAVRLEITGKNAGERSGKAYTWYGSFTDTKMGERTVAERTIESLVFLGCRLKDDDPTDTHGFDTNEVDLVITEEEDLKGVLRERAAFINRRGGVALKKVMSDDKKAVFGKNMRGLVANTRKAMAERGNQGENAGGLPTGADGKPIF